MITSVSAYELNEVEGNEHGQGKEAEPLNGTGYDKVDGHLRAKEISLQLPDEQHVRVHKGFSLGQKLTLWTMLLITVCTLGWDVFSILSAINLLVHARAIFTQSSELIAARLCENLHANAAAQPLLNCGAPHITRTHLQRARRSGRVRWCRVPVSKRTFQ